ncbi:MAG: Gfo/Idh/MocA family oxidoreductase [Chloroflexia bacterium]|nr:Gfo/Idh/MocA family oxidoreductase [Chloroflexia bacterium]
MQTDRTRIAIIGTAKRASYLYAPLLRWLPDVDLVAVWGRSDGSARRLGETLGVPAYTDLDRLKRETAPEIGIVTVSYGANGEVGLMAVEAGLHVLLETPVAHELEEADRIIEAAQSRAVKVEVAEQFHRRPMEALKLQLIRTGLFGRVHSSFNDFAGHGYHGVSVMRSYLGFDAVSVRVSGAVEEYPLVAGKAETQEHGTVWFEGGRLGFYHWTNVGYSSPLRWWRSSRFLAERGMGITVGVGPHVEERLTLLSEDGEAPRFITVERKWERVDGGALTALIAHTGDSDIPVVRWDNPFLSAVQGHGPQWHDDEIGVAGCIMSLVSAVRNETAPTYGPCQARLDQEIVLAIRASSDNGGSPVDLPFGREG